MLNFFDEKYNQEKIIRKDVLFGIVDKETESFARTTNNPKDEPWDARISNAQELALHFIPVDKNIIIKINGNPQSMCDGLLHEINNKWIAFVEIKNRRKSDFLHAKEQLISTIELFSQNHDINAFEKRLAYIADRKHPDFQYSHKTEMNEF